MHATLHSKPILQFGMPFHFATTQLAQFASGSIDPQPSQTEPSFHNTAEIYSSKMQGVKGSGDPPKPDGKELESESAKQMRKAGFERAQAEDWQKKGVMEKIQATTSHIKDAAAEKMDQLATK